VRRGQVVKATSKFNVGKIDVRAFPEAFRRSRHTLEYDQTLRDCLLHSSLGVLCEHFMAAAEITLTFIAQKREEKKIWPPAGYIFNTMNFKSTCSNQLLVASKPSI
jgi:hypothetical protein